MDKTVRKVTDHAELEAETYRYWRSRSPAERYQATWELSVDQYRDYNRRKGIPDAERSARTVTRVQRKKD